MNILQKKQVVVIGSSRINTNSIDCKVAYELGKQLAVNKITVITGGGPGIMLSANKGAKDIGGKSFGYSLNIKDQKPNSHCSNGKLFTCNTFQERKQLMMKDIDAFIVFPGGFGTLDELFEILVHILTNKIKAAPIILYNKDFWNNLLFWINSKLLTRKMVKGEDINVIKVTNTLEEILEIILKNKS